MEKCMGGLFKFKIPEWRSGVVRPIQHVKIWHKNESQREQPLHAWHVDCEFKHAVDWTGMGISKGTSQLSGKRHWLRAAWIFGRDWIQRKQTGCNSKHHTVWRNIHGVQHENIQTQVLCCLFAVDFVCCIILILILSIIIIGIIIIIAFGIMPQFSKNRS